MAEQKKQSFLHGAALLAAATAIVKVIGAFYKIPLNAIIGTKGFAYFNTAYNIYTVLLLVSTAGLPVAMSKMISAANSLGNTRQVKRIYRTAQTIFLCLGIPFGILMTCFAKPLAVFQEQPDAWAAIACLGPSAFLMCLVAAFRGFFQGHRNMMPTSVSQVLEASCKLVVGLAVAFAIKKMTAQIPLAAGGAILGVTVGCAASAFYLFWLFRKAYKSLEEGDPTLSPDSYTKTARDLLAIAVPITIGSAGLQLITLLEIKVYMGQLLSTGFTQDAADTMKGIYDMAQTIFNMPCAFIIPITVSGIPTITAALTVGDHRQVKATEESASRIMALISMPCALGLFVVARPVMALLGGYTGAELDLAENLMRLLSLCIVFNSFVLLTNAVMQAHGHANIPVVNMFVGGVVKLGVAWLLTGNAGINIQGVPVASVACFLTIATLNLFSMNRCIKHPPHMLRNMARPCLSGLIMAAAVFGVYFGLGRVFGLDSTLGKLMLVGVPVLAGVVVYVVCVIKLKAITREDCLLLPKGEKIAKLLHL